MTGRILFKLSGMMHKVFSASQAAEARAIRRAMLSAAANSILKEDVTTCIKVTKYVDIALSGLALL